MSEQEKVLLIQIMSNVDDIIGIMTEEQRSRSDKCIKKIYGNYHNILEGVKEDG